MGAGCFKNKNDFTPLILQFSDVYFFIILPDKIEVRYCLALLQEIGIRLLTDGFYFTMLDNDDDTRCC
ncbi:MAG: hypothetical protein L0Y73_09395 [Candidatus Aminicenantes bacterium]|nr:hypothetical protein [Candidatus Aminicenantes bacterium]